MKRICVFTSYNYSSIWSELGQLSAANKKEYADLHGYDFCCHNKWWLWDKTGTIFGVVRQGSWAKYRAIIEELPKYDWIFFSEADTFITNKNVKLESFFDDRYDLIFSGIDAISVGSFFIKSTLWSEMILNELDTRKEYYPYYRLADWDESAMKLLLNEKDPSRERHRMYSYRYFNAMAPEAGYPEEMTWQPGDFIIHFARIFPVSERLVLARKYL